MRVLMVSKALVVGEYQRKAEEIAKLGVELTVLVPPAWGDRRGHQVLERVHTHGYELREMPVRFNGNFHLHYYPRFKRELKRVQPDIVHMDEEPYNLATWLTLRAAHAAGVPALFFTWQNINRRYPQPFRHIEQANYHRAAAVLAGSEGACEVLREKGCRAPIHILPQFGVDPAAFAPAAAEDGSPTGPLRIGYAGGLLPEKGLDLLLRACAKLGCDWTLRLAGSGDEEAALRRLADELAIVDRISFDGRIASTDMPAFYHKLDVFALPSRTTPSWKEQFGRVLIEAMACEVAVVGSDSGEIPHVVGDAGCIFPEDNADALREQLQRLADDAAYRQRMGAAGRQRVLERYTMQRIASETVDVYAQMLA